MTMSRVVGSQSSDTEFVQEVSLFHAMQSLPDEATFRRYEETTMNINRTTPTSGVRNLAGVQVLQSLNVGFLGRDSG